MSRAARWRALAVAVVVGAHAAHAQSDTVTPPRSLFTWRDGLLAGVFVGATLAIEPIDRSVAERLQRPGTQERANVQTAAKAFRLVAFPGTTIIGASMYAIGRATRSHRTSDLAVHGTEALLIGEGLAAGMKGVFGRQRPYVNPDTLDPHKWHFFRGFVGSDGQRSFPSGHATAAFAVAAAVTAETSRWWPSSRYLIGTAMYGGAGMVGLSRMYNNRHWASDVIMGAAIGTFAGNKVVRYHHSHPGNRLDQWLVNFSITPSGAGHAFSATILPRLGTSIGGRR
jgi:hypothetical protein